MNVTASDPSKTASRGALPDWLRGDDLPWWRRPGFWGALLLLVLLAAGAWFWQQHKAAQAAPHYVTEAVTRGDLALEVTATGTLQPLRSIAIGSELSGTVTQVLVDVNDKVRKGQVLVELDTANLKATLTRSMAAVQSARASVAQADATVAQTQAALGRLETVHRLSGGKLPAPTELDTAQANYKSAVANAEAARAAVAQAEATLSTDRTNLSKASIRAPSDGVILTRAVEPGNAVAASLQAVTLFTMAPNLAELKLSVAVDEADVGQVKKGDKAYFTVAAWPGRRYPAAIARVAYASTLTENVVTYTADLAVDNADLSLRPGMSATATIAATQHQGVLMVPNTALSFAPAGAGAAGGADASASGGGGKTSILDKLMPHPPRNATAPRPQGEGHGTAAAAGGNQREIWVLRDGRPDSLRVTTGLSDGRHTEVSGPGVAEGLAVITEQRTGKAP